MINQLQLKIIAAAIQSLTFSQNGI